MDVIKCASHADDVRRGIWRREQLRLPALISTADGCCSVVGAAAEALRGCCNLVPAPEVAADKVPADRNHTLRTLAVRQQEVGSCHTMEPAADAKAADSRKWVAAHTLIRMMSIRNPT